MKGHLERKSLTEGHTLSLPTPKGVRIDHRRTGGEKFEKCTGAPLVVNTLNDMLSNNGRRKRRFKCRTRGHQRRGGEYSGKEIAHLILPTSGELESESWEQNPKIGNRGQFLHVFLKGSGKFEEDLNLSLSYTHGGGRFGAWTYLLKKKKKRADG